MLHESIYHEVKKQTKGLVKQLKWYGVCLASVRS
jgi:hypothetical protein